VVSWSPLQISKKYCVISVSHESQQQCGGKSRCTGRLDERFESRPDYAPYTVAIKEAAN
jgi:hypothetical protein